MESAFGVEHTDEIAKKKDDKYGGHGAPSSNRRAMAMYLHPVYGAAAGKKGKKLRAMGNEVVAGTAGSGAGAGIGAGLGALTRHEAGVKIGAGGGAIIGNALGVQAGVNRNQRKGYYKKEKK